VLPVLARTRRDYSADLAVIVVNVIPSTPVQEFVRYMKARGGSDHFYANDIRLEVATAYEVQYLGTLLAVDQQGRVIAKWNDSVSYDQVKKTMDQLRS